MKNGLTVEDIERIRKKLRELPALGPSRASQRRNKKRRDMRAHARAIRMADGDREWLSCFLNKDKASASTREFFREIDEEFSNVKGIWEMRVPSREARTLAFWNRWDGHEEFPKHLDSTDLAFALCDDDGVSRADILADVWVAVYSDVLECVFGEHFGVSMYRALDGYNFKVAEFVEEAVAESRERLKFALKNRDVIRDEIRCCIGNVVRAIEKAMTEK